MRVYKHRRPIVWVFSDLELLSTMPEHDHSLQKLYSIEGLSNPSMVYNWICPMQLKEDCPYKVLAHVFNEYFTDTNRINTNEDYLNFRLVHTKTSCQEDAFVSTVIILVFCSTETTLYFVSILWRYASSYLCLFPLLQSLGFSNLRSFRLSSTPPGPMATAHLV